MKLRASAFVSEDVYLRCYQAARLIVQCLFYIQEAAARIFFLVRNLLYSNALQRKCKKNAKKNAFFLSFFKVQTIYK